MHNPVKKCRSENLSEAAGENVEDGGFVDSSKKLVGICPNNTNEERNSIVNEEVSSVRRPTDRDILNLEKTLLDELSSIPDAGKKEWALDRVRNTLGESLPESLVQLVAAHAFHGDAGTSFDVRPSWLDVDKFRRGQRFSLDNHFGLCYAQMVSLFTAFSFEESLKPLIATGASDTPYTAFKRYLSTNLRIVNWYTSDPWVPDTPAYNDIKSVRRAHEHVRKRMAEMDDEEARRRTTIETPWCPVLEVARRDLQSTCPLPPVGQCPYALYSRLPSYRRMHLNQYEMAGTQFAFIGLLLLRPEFFGVHRATDEDLESFCHLWRCVGYLLGIDDDFNFCRGTLQDVRNRSKDFLEYWVKPNLRQVKPELEHMMRCVVEGLQYYSPGPTYETSLLDLAAVMDLDLPQLYHSLSYPVRIKHWAMRFYFEHASKIGWLRCAMNRALMRDLQKAKNYNEEKHRELKEKSDRTLAAYSGQLEKTVNNTLALVFQKLCSLLRSFT